MKTIKINSIKILNFKGIRELEIDLNGENTLIRGENATGKTTIADAVYWVLFDKMLDGTRADEIRPHDKERNIQHYIDIAVGLALTVDGSPITIQKKQSEKWVTPRGKTEQEYQGNENSYYVNDVPMTEKAYKAKIAEIVSEDVFYYASSGEAILNMDAKKRRALLMNLAKDFDYNKIIESNSELEILSPILADYTYEEALAKEQHAIKKLDSDLKEIPIRIDELSKSKAEGNMEELIKVRDELNARINGASDVPEIAELAELKIKRSNMITEAEMKAKEKKTEFVNKANELGSVADELENDHKKLLSQIKGVEFSKQSAKENVEKYREMYKDVQAKAFEAETICPTCGQTIPEDKIDKAKADFEKNKKAEIANITKLGNEAKAQFTKLEEEVEKLKSDETALEAKMNAAKEEYEKAKKSATNVNIGVIDTSEIDAQIEEKQKAVDLLEKVDISELTNQLTEISRQIAKLEMNADIEERISMLELERQGVSQDLSSHKKVKYALEQYNRERIKMLTDEVNNNFKLVKWVLFRDQINGGIQEVCDATVDGSIVGNGLNHGHTILAKVDIAMAFQKIYEVSVPLFIDDTESVSEESNIDTGESQKILLKVSNGPLEVSKC